MTLQSEAYGKGIESKRQCGCVHWFKPFRSGIGEFPVGVADPARSPVVGVKPDNPLTARMGGHSAKNPALRGRVANGGEFLKILAVDSSARAASAAVCDDERILCESYVDVKLTHSETLLPMLDAMLHAAALTLPEIDYLAVSAGPGSFTGLRIGIAAVKGLAFPNALPCIAVSTLEGLAYNLTGQSCVACAVMDARCKQVYTACFEVQGDEVKRITDDDAITIDALREKLLRMPGEKPIILVGDGAVLCYNSLGENRRIQLAPAQLRYQHANSVCRAAQRQTGLAVSANELMPAYLRLPQAQRELLKKEGKQE